MSHAQDSGARLRLLLAHAAVWIIWGSTYLAIRFAIESMPPMFMSATRFLLAGALLLGWQAYRGKATLRVEHWRPAIIVGTLLLMFGNGGVAWAEQTVPSGIAALTVAVVPIWIVLLNWLTGGARPTPPLIAGLALGLLGVGVLMNPRELLGSTALDPVGLGVVAFGSVAWAAGSIYSRHAAMPDSPLTGTALQMLCGGVALLLASALLGESWRIDPDALSTASVLAWLYLVVFGSLVAFTAYIYLLQNTEPAKATTYAYVNPVIAVLLGWALASEPLDARVLLALALIVPAVALVVSFRRRR